MTDITVPNAATKPAASTQPSKPGPTTASPRAPFNAHLPKMLGAAAPAARTRATIPIAQPTGVRFAHHDHEGDAQLPKRTRDLRRDTRANTDTEAGSATAARVLQGAIQAAPAPVSARPDPASLSNVLARLDQVVTSMRVGKVGAAHRLELSLRDKHGVPMDVQVDVASGRTMVTVTTAWADRAAADTLRDALAAEFHRRGLAAQEIVVRVQ